MTCDTKKEVVRTPSFSSSLARHGISPTLCLALGDHLHWKDFRRFREGKCPQRSDRVHLPNQGIGRTSSSIPRRRRNAPSCVSCSLTYSRSRDVHDVVHKVTAVGSRSVHSATQFIAEQANGDLSIKAYGNYAEVYADSVRRCIRVTLKLVGSQRNHKERRCPLHRSVLVSCQS